MSASVQRETDDKRCDLCGGDFGIVNAVSDELGSFAICAGCAELWTTYLMHHPMPRRLHPADDEGQRRGA